MKRKKMNKLFLILSLLLASATLSSCRKDDSAEVLPAVRFLYAGGQGDNTFQMWIWIYEDNDEPALVHSGKCRYLDDAYVETDIERLSYRQTPEGFTLSDLTTGEIRYTAVYRSSPYTDALDESRVRLSWSHSPGSTWDALAEELDWQRTIDLALQSFPTCVTYTE
jgi:hypothetical protein